MNKTTIFFAQFKDNNLRLDKFLTNKLISFTRSQIKKIIDSKAIKIDNQIIISASRKVKDGEKIIQGAEAFLVLWKKIPKYKFLYNFLKLPIIFSLFSLSYEIIAFFFISKK